MPQVLETTCFAPTKSLSGKIRGMGRLISVVGNTGVGKTTLTQALCRLAPFTSGMEQHEGRPFQRLFALGRQRYALANQVDYLLFRAEQEVSIRNHTLDGIQDGGLELDYFVFTRRFYQQGYLDEREFELCTRMYHLLRQRLPLPEAFVYLTAPLDVIARRFEQRGRKLEIASRMDLQAMQVLLDEWIGGLQAAPVILVDASQDDARYEKVGERLVGQIRAVMI